MRKVVLAGWRKHNQIGSMVLVLWLAWAVRLIEMYGHNLWIDEAFHVYVARQPFWELLTAFGRGTNFPPLFGWMLHLWMENGQIDFYLRMLPVLTSVLAVAVMFALGRLVFSPSVGWVSAFVVAVAPRSVYYGQEVTPYPFVLLLAALCPLLLERYYRRPALVRLLSFIGAGAAAISLHYEMVPYVMALVLVGTAYLFVRVWHRERRQFVYWMLGLGVLALIGIALLLYHALPQQAQMGSTFVPARYKGTISLRNEVAEWFPQTVELVRFLFWSYEPTSLKWFTVILLVLGGIAAMAFSSRRVVVYLVVGLLIGYIASGFGVMPYANRYVWYAFPLCTLLVCAGAFAPAQARTKGYPVFISWGVAAVLIGLLVAHLPRVSGKLPETEQFNDVLQYVEKRRQPEDTVYVYYGAVLAFRVYAAQAVANGAVLESWDRALPLAEQRAKMWAVMEGKPRTWLLMSHVNPGDDTNLLDKLNKKCRSLDAIQVVGAAGYLFDCALAQ